MGKAVRPQAAYALLWTLAKRFNTTMIMMVIFAQLIDAPPCIPARAFFLDFIFAMT